MWCFGHGQMSSTRASHLSSRGPCLSYLGAPGRITHTFTHSSGHLFPTKVSSSSVWVAVGVPQAFPNVRSLLSQYARTPPPLQTNFRRPRTTAQSGARVRVDAVRECTGPSLAFGFQGWSRQICKDTSLTAELSAGRKNPVFRQIKEIATDERDM